MKRKTLIPLLGILVLICIGLYLFQVYTINSFYAPYCSRVETYEVGETIDLGPNYFDTISENPSGYQITVKSCKVTTYGEFIQRYNGNLDTSWPDKPVYDIEVEFHNENATEGYINLARYALQQYGLQEYQDFELAQLMEPRLPAIPAFKLKLGNTVTYHLPFIYGTENAHESGGEGKLCNQDDLYLVVSQYPIKKQIHVKFTN